MSRRTCPAEHVEYLSRMLAENAVTLHKFIHPECPGIEWFKCNDHFHIGHPGNNKAICPPGTKPMYPNVRRVVKGARKRRSRGL